MLQEFWRNELAEDAEDIDERRMLQLYEQRQTVRQRAQSSSGRTQRRRYLNRDREIGHARLFNDYFSDDPVDAAGKKGFSPLQKCTTVIRQLAYGAPADHYDECVIEVFGAQYLRKSNAVNIKHLLEMHEQRHGFPGMLGSLDWSHNDIYVLNESPLFNDVLQGNTPEEAARKDVERAFGVLQSRWAMIKGPGRFWYKDNLKDIMYTYIILHNMIIENEGDAVVNWSDDEGASQSQIFEGSTQEFQAYIRRNYELRDNQLHHQLRADVVEYIWARYNCNQ
ncbi:uncharacterized protein LOC122048118 [Zingiber officinale]|uniref:uncharacterized protein LOC122048118 n=1 Tax=Zingiber officinale TaxID=94328 RepID=UPI001C4AC508|nr:uncharacterized protein LOC122048118 [Zingiber officinale]